VATSTTRLGLTKPAGSDVVDVAVLNANSDKIDAAVGIVVCTSTTRPLSPYEGQQIYETDTKNLQTYASGGWKPTVNTTIFSTIAQSAVAPVAETPVADQTARDALFPSPVQGNAVWRKDKGYGERYYGLYNSSTNPGGRATAGWYPNERNYGLVPAVPASISNSGGTVTQNQSLVTFTNVNSVALNTVFGSNARHYRIIIDITGISVNGAGATINFRNGTTNDTSNSYYQFWTMKRSTGATQDNTGGPATGYSLFAASTGANVGTWSGDIMLPNLAAATQMNGVGFGADATSLYQITSSMIFWGNTTFDGISFTASSGATMTGTVQILAYTY
jgi:hypothetical protein